MSTWISSLTQDSFGRIINIFNQLGCITYFCFINILFYKELRSENVA